MILLFGLLVACGGAAEQTEEETSETTSETSETATTTETTPEPEAQEAEPEETPAPAGQKTSSGGEVPMIRGPTLNFLMEEEQETPEAEATMEEEEGEEEQEESTATESEAMMEEEQETPEAEATMEEEEGEEEQEESTATAAPAVDPALVAYAAQHANGPGAIYVGDINQLVGPAPSTSQGDFDGNVTLESLQRHLWIYDSDIYQELLEKANLTNPTPLEVSGESITIQHACINRALLPCQLLETYFTLNLSDRTDGQVDFIVSSFPELGLAGPDTLSLVSQRTLDSANIYVGPGRPRYPESRVPKNPGLSQHLRWLCRWRVASHRDSEPVGHLFQSRTGISSHAGHYQGHRGTGAGGYRRSDHEPQLVRRQRPVLLLPGKDRQH